MVQESAEIIARYTPIAFDIVLDEEGSPEKVFRWDQTLCRKIIAYVWGACSWESVAEGNGHMLNGNELEDQLRAFYTHCHQQWALQAPVDIEMFPEKEIIIPPTVAVSFLRGKQCYAYINLRGGAVGLHQVAARAGGQRFCEDLSPAEENTLIEVT